MYGSWEKHICSYVPARWNLQLVASKIDYNSIRTNYYYLGEEHVLELFQGKLKKNPECLQKNCITQVF